MLSIINVLTAFDNLVNPHSLDYLAKKGVLASEPTAIAYTNKIWHPANISAAAAAVKSDIKNDCIIGAVAWYNT